MEYMGAAVSVIFAAWYFRLLGDRPYILFAIVWLMLAVGFLKAAPQLSKFSNIVVWFMLAVFLLAAMAEVFGYAGPHIFPRRAGP